MAEIMRMRMVLKLIDCRCSRRRLSFFNLNLFLAGLTQINQLEADTSSQAD